MAQYRLRNVLHKRGFSYEHGRGPTDKKVVPWAITDEHKVVYAETGVRPPDPKTGLKPYSAFVGQERRKQCESALADIVRVRSAPVLPAVQRTTTGLKQYLGIKRGKADADVVDGKIDDSVQKYMYSENYGYGRLGSRKRMPTTRELRIAQTLAALDNAQLPVVLGIHDTFARKVFPDLGPSDNPLDSAMKKRYEHCGTLVRPSGEGQLFNPASRGRKERVYEGPLTEQATARLPSDPSAAQKVLQKGVGPQPTKVSGILSANADGDELQKRIRGVDLFEPVEDTAFVRDVVARNLVFGAGPSGTTGTLLQACVLFGNITRGELLKQYVLAIVVYLVGGGMHSCHEVFTTANLYGIPYIPGAYLTMLPNSFRFSRDFDWWEEEYFDIVRYGHLQGRLRTG